MVDTDDDKKQGKTFSLTKGLLRRLQAVLEQNSLDSSGQNDLVELLLDHSLHQVEEGIFVLPIEHVAVLKKTR